MADVYVTLIEDNDHEGERWRFYLPTAGNEAGLLELRDRLESMKLDGFGSYKLDMTPVTEEQVNDRVALADEDGGYLPAHTKLSGTLQPLPAKPEPREDISDAEWLDELLYKGGIKDLFK